MITATIAGNPVAVKEQSIKRSKTLDARTTCSFVVEDASGTNRYVPGQTVVLTDSVKGVVFEGYINDGSESNLYPNSNNEVTIQCVDNHYIADKRYYNGPEFVNQYAGDIATSLVSSTLAGEGINANFALDRDTLQSDFSQGTLTGTVATTTGGGDLELAPGGTTVTTYFTGGAVGAFSALKMTGTASQGFNDNYVYRKIWTGSYTVASNDSLVYDIWIQSDSPEQKSGIDIQFTDGTRWRDTGNNDFQGLSPHPSTDLSGFATDQWYSRSMGMPMTGKTIAYVSAALEGNSAGNYTTYIRRLSIMNGSTHKLDIIIDNTTSLQANSLVANNGYANVSLSIVQACNKINNIFFNYDLTNANTIQSIITTWDPSTLTIPSDAQYYMQTSLDVGSSRQLVTNGKALTNYVPGGSVVSRNLFLWKYLNAGKDPTALAGMAYPTTPFIKYSAPANSSPGSNVFAKYDLNSEWDTGTHSGTKSGGQSNLQMAGFAFPLANYGDWGSSTTFGSGAPFVYEKAKLLGIQANNGGDGRLRFDSAGTWTNFTAEVDVQIQTNSDLDIEYRTTNWSNNINTFAYTLGLTPTSIMVTRGANTTGTGSTVVVGTASVSLASNSWHHLKLVVNGSNHKAYLDDILYINATDATWAGPGNVGLRFYNGTGSTTTGFFQNFGISPSTSTLTGTWTSPAIDISPAQNFGSSMILWDNSQSQTDGLTYIPTGASIAINASVDGGTTWLACTNGGAIPGLTAGQSLAAKTLKFQAVLTAQNAAFPPTLGGLSVWLSPPYLASGSRVAPPLSLKPVGRAGSALVSWSGVQPANTNIYVDTSLDGFTFTQIGSGAVSSGNIAGINTYPEPYLDDFLVDTTASYSSGNKTGGSLATWAINTGAGTLTATGGSNAIFLYKSLSALDISLSCVLDRSDGAGLVLRYQDSSNFYYAVIRDASAATEQNTARIWKVAGGSSTALGSGAYPISFSRGTAHTFVLSMIDNVIALSMDGTTIASVDDSQNTPLGSGKVGMLNDTGTGLFYLFRAQAYGDNVSVGIGKQVFTRIRMTSSDPTVTPAINEVTTSVRNSNVNTGAFIASTAYSILNSNNTVAASLDDLAKQSDAYWDIDKALNFYFQTRVATLAPWPAGPADILLGFKIDNVDDNYRNSQWIKGGYDSVPLTQSFVGDGNTKSWNLAYPVDFITSISVNNVQDTKIGVKGSSGYDYYYQRGNNGIAADSSSTALNSSQTLTVSYNGLVPATVNVKRDSAIAARALIDHTTGIIEVSESVDPSLNKAAMITTADSRITQFCKSARSVQFDTLRDGLEPGQLLPIFLPPHGLAGDVFLISQVDLAWRTVNLNGVWTLQPVYSVQATEGAIVGDWTRFYINLAKLQ